MAVRKCPNCLKEISPAVVVAYSDDIECPGCQRHLEVWDASRLLASLAGILAGALAWRGASTWFAGGMRGWTLPVLFAILAYGAMSALFLMATADLPLKPYAPPAAPSAARH